MSGLTTIKKSMLEAGFDSRKITVLLMVIVTALSWFLFPVMLKFLAPYSFRIVFALSFSVLLVFCIRYLKVNRLSFSYEQQLFFFAWAGYLVFLLFATVGSESSSAYEQYFKNLIKVLFFVILLLYMNHKFVERSFTLYSLIMIGSVIGSVMVSIGVALEFLEPVATFRNSASVETDYAFDVYWGAYYGLYNTQYDVPFTLLRMQGFSEEPGTFAFSILPALFWMFVVKRAYLASSILLIGLLASSSVGAMMVMLLLLIIAWGVVRGPREPVLSLSLASGVLLLVGYLSFQLGQEAMINGLSGWLKTQVLPGYSSMGDRIEAIYIVVVHLLSNPFGTGAGLGMTTVDYAIAVGYANAALEGGVVGGILYLFMFLLLTRFSVQALLASFRSYPEHLEMLAIGMSVLSCVIMGIQRQQPDISFWHMWIYASFFFKYLSSCGKFEAKERGGKIG